MSWGAAAGPGGTPLLSLHWETPCHLYAAPGQQVGSLRPRPVSLGKGPEQVVPEPRGPQEVLADPAAVLGAHRGPAPVGHSTCPGKHVFSAGTGGLLAVSGRCKASFKKQNTTSQALRVQQPRPPLLSKAVFGVCSARGSAVFRTESPEQKVLINSRHVGSVSRAGGCPC